MTKLLYPELTYILRGIGFQIHNELGAGHAEKDYECALCYGMEEGGIPFRSQQLYHVHYRNQQVGEYRPDIVLENGSVILDLKATPRIEAVHKAQVISYNVVTGAELGLIMNFGGTSLQFERLPNFLENRQRQDRTAPITTDGFYPELTHEILNALFVVHRTLGPGFLHQVYRRATRIELSNCGINFEYLKELALKFKGQSIAQKETRLFWIEGKILLATVALSQIKHDQTEKMRWAMRETGCQLGMIANFYPSQLDIRFLRLPGK